MKLTIVGDKNVRLPNNIGSNTDPDTRLITFYQAESILQQMNDVAPLDRIATLGNIYKGGISVAVPTVAGGAAAIAAVPWVVNYYLGISDFKFMPKSDLKTSVLNKTGPCISDELGAVAVGRNEAELNTKHTNNNFEQSMFETIMLIIGRMIFANLCPNISHTPCVALDSVKQVYNNTNGISVTMSINDYFQNGFAATRVNGVKDFQKGAVHHMVQNMDPRIKTELMSKPGAKHPDSHPLDAGT